MSHNLCSCVVQTRPHAGALVAPRIISLPGCEVHAGIAEDKLVVTIEDEDGQSAADLIGAINGIDGVVNTILIYHYGGDDLDRPMAALVN